MEELYTLRRKDKVYEETIKERVTWQMHIDNLDLKLQKQTENAIALQQRLTMVEVDNEIVRQEIADTTSDLSKLRLKVHDLSETNESNNIKIKEQQLTIEIRTQKLNAAEYQVAKLSDVNFQLSRTAEQQSQLISNHEAKIQFDKI